MSKEDSSLIRKLRQLDDAWDIDVTSEEADFLEEVCFRQQLALTPEQRKYGKRMIRKYKIED
jgi:hypothetical protein